MKTDQIFKEKIENSTDFSFDADVADVFDDMVVRSVPFYAEFQRMISEQAQKYAKPDTSLYDLGCSTGTTLLLLNKTISPTVKFVGVDNSPSMIGICRSDIENAKFKRPYELIVSDISKSLEVKNASVVVLCLTLQFIRPVNRERLLQSVYRQMNKGGAIVIVEKVLAENELFNRQMIEYYYDFKRRNHYDEMEIAQKREALENVLIPYKVSENLKMLEDAGFKSGEVFFKWYNFAGIIAVK